MSLAEEAKENEKENTPPPPATNTNLPNFPRFIIMVICCHKNLHKLKRWREWETNLAYHLVRSGTVVRYILGRKIKKAEIKKQIQVQVVIPVGEISFYYGEQEPIRVVDKEKEEEVEIRTISNLWELDVGDSYEELPEKVIAGFEKIIQCFPMCLGVFKTDDDVELMPGFFPWLAGLRWIPYWGISVGHVFQPTIYEYLYRRAAQEGKHLERKTLVQSIHATGRGYYVSRRCCEIVVTAGKTRVLDSYHEDYLVGKLLNEVGIFPVEMGFRLNSEHKLLD